MNKFTLLAGSCVIENEKHALELSTVLRNIVSQYPIFDFYYKSSFDKANRTSRSSGRGVGMSEGLRILRKVKEEVGVKVITDVHECWQVGEVSYVADAIQVPALLCRQTDLLELVGKTNCAVNVKKGQWVAPWDAKHIIEKVNWNRRGRELDTWITERGTVFGYNRNVVDMTGLRVMALHAPVIIDCTHSVQAPGAMGGVSGGDRKFAPSIAKAAVATGYCKGMFCEVHDDPDNALSDGPNSLDIDMFGRLIRQIAELVEVTERWKSDLK